MRTARPCTSIALLVVLHYHALATHLCALINGRRRSSEVKFIGGAEREHDASY